MSVLIDTLSWLLLMAGTFLGISGAIGILRFPDFYSRVHAASITDTLCVLLIITGLLLQAGFTLVSAKLIIILLFIWYTSPAAGHALVKAAHHHGLQPFIRQVDGVTQVENTKQTKQEEKSSKS